MSDEREKVEAAKNRLANHQYMEWGYAGGPNECKHGYAEGIPCQRCDEDLTGSLPAPAVSQSVDAAQVESGDGLPPLLAEWEDANVQRVYSILNDELEHKSDEEHWEGYCARWIVGELIDPLNAEIERLKGLLREAEVYINGKSRKSIKLRERIKVVTGE